MTPKTTAKKQTTMSNLPAPPGGSNNLSESDPQAMSTVAPTESTGLSDDTCTDPARTQSGQHLPVVDDKSNTNTSSNDAETTSSVTYSTQAYSVDRSDNTNKSYKTPNISTPSSVLPASSQPNQVLVNSQMLRALLTMIPQSSHHQTTQLGQANGSEQLNQYAGVAVGMQSGGDHRSGGRGEYSIF